MLTFIKAARELAEKNRQKRNDAKERRAVANAFNNRYTYRVRYDFKRKDHLPGTGMGGVTPPAGNAWMCPECNTIHLAVACSVFDGLHFPACCYFSMGNRLGQGIKTR